MSEAPPREIEAYDAEYNASVPANWWLSDEWRPKKFAYGSGLNGSGDYGVAEGTPLQANNAYCIIRYFKKQGWAFEAICALLGNMQGESQMNPGYWESYGNTSLGFGLVQWTPASGYFSDQMLEFGANDPWAPYYYSGWYECYRIAEEVFNRPRQWVPVYAGAGFNPSRPDRNYTLTFEDFALGIVIPDDVPDTPEGRIDYLTSAFYWCYEQVAIYVDDQTEQQRQTRAKTWFNRFVPIFGNFKGKDALKDPATKPGPYFGLGNLAAAWWYKVLYMASRRNGGLKKYAR